MYPKMREKIKLAVRQSFTRIVFAIFIFSFVTRLIIFQNIGPLAQGDTAHYLGVSENIVEYGAILETDSFTGELRPQTLRTPGYPLLIAFFYKLFGIGQTALKALVIFQIAIISGISILAAYIGRRFLTAEAGILAALISALDPWLSYAAVTLMSEALFSILYLASFLIGAIAIQKRSSKWALFWGVILALCTLVRPVTQQHFVIPLLLFALLPITLPYKLRLIALSLIGFSLLVGGWIYRNKVQTGHAVLVTHQGISLLWETTHLTRSSTPQDYLEDEQLARARDIIAATPQIIDRLMAENPHQPPLEEGQIAYTNLRQELGLSEYEADAVMEKIAVENILSNPFQFLFLAPRNIFIFLTSVSRPISFGIDLGLIDSSVLDNLESRTYSYPAVNLGLRILTIICFGPLLLGGILCSWLRLPNSRYLTLAFLLALAYHFLVVTLVAADDRYRLPLHGMMWLYVGYGLVYLPWPRWLAAFRRPFSSLRLSLLGRMYNDLSL